MKSYEVLKVFTQKHIFTILSANTFRNLASDQKYKFLKMLLVRFCTQPNMYTKSISNRKWKENEKRKAIIIIAGVRIFITY